MAAGGVTEIRFPAPASAGRRIHARPVLAADCPIQVAHLRALATRPGGRCGWESPPRG